MSNNEFTFLQQRLATIDDSIQQVVDENNSVKETISDNFNSLKATKETLAAEHFE